MNASDGAEEPAGADPLTESQALLSLDFIRLPRRLEKDVTSDPPGAAPSVHNQKCRREYGSMMAMSPTWGFWQRRMVRGEGA